MIANHDTTRININYDISIFVWPYFKLFMQNCQMHLPRIQYGLAQTTNRKHSKPLKFPQHTLFLSSLLKILLWFTTVNLLCFTTVNHSVFAEFIMLYHSKYYGLPQYILWFTTVNTTFTMVYYSEYHILLWFTTVNTTFYSGLLW